ncbi:MAG: hypothetical protein UX85_C0002G0052 [Candidatus Beckwithbacteria bacterium GW2011_GWB1_47_15]|uniref:Phage-related protein n=1 Tax=Candidatus Beckwithbacteria bacterium GW2011_GWB1_47_15 TaxID=1618371 RepID=A0A0G1RX12_9BACT|nr:MAG: hypothetical protein UY43_C0001G0640 [Candidatus Beckwithbacteria bacterium GW2011_GWC1_49_16]KKU35618.1 MAG: hypothetical protein UX50_C0002G0045 [Candidatus Beckwithbacteria bacterium GW2011_GWA1_46_30]KKU61672.1 MAG: hypothetical protein UX85_C0002G0052 [Candidatus Beckwithbacteria bacterium GW2011_GWB1_47_15]KKU72175.1 MAG: hypothetical protein UX97_C0001G0045 [Candidatus Beckwithbacteria bacterium GW2011_GWA2_47_25]KKW04800.1 MAG: hypothetical protein UY37_C0002G0053 [Candidatus Be
MRVEVFTSAERKSPIDDFIEKCPKGQRSKIIRQLYYLQEFGLTRANPSLKKLTGAVFWELRILGKDNIRLLCAQINKSTIMIFNIFYKKKRKTPIKDINLALKRYYQLLDK